MPNPIEPIHPEQTGESSYLELIAETLETMDRAVTGQFLQRFFKTIANLDLTEAVSLHYWEQVLERRRELTGRLGKPFSLKAAIVDVLASSSYLRVPVLMEYEELKKLQINAATDPLTGLHNRRLFQEQFDKELNRALRYSHNLALVLVDLHQFKQINDRYGHPRGDTLLQTAAETLRTSLRTSDYAFRIGGDEFALLLVQSDVEQASALARRIRTNFSTAIQPMQLSGNLGMDYGIAIYPQDGDQKEALVRIADERLFEMKHLHRAAQVSGTAVTRRTSWTPPPAPAPKPAQAAPPPEPAPTPAPKLQPVETAPSQFGGIERRKWERVSLADTRAYGQLADDPRQTARVLDLSYGGVSFETASNEDLGSTFYAVLHVPILPPVRVSLKRLYQIRNSDGLTRTGCSFIT